MKKVLLAVAMLAVAVTAGAQNPNQLLSSIEKAKAATENPKKASNPNTWIKYGDALSNAYISLFGDFRVGWNVGEVMMFNTQTPISQEQVQKGGVSFTVEHYELRDLYFNNSTGILDAVVITKPITDYNLLIAARDAYLKAADLDLKGSKTKVLTSKLISMRDRLVECASGSYALGDLAEAAKFFEESLSCSDNKIVNTIDTLMVYNAGIMYGAVGNVDKAKKYYQECIDLGYDSNGDVSASLAEIMIQEGNLEGAKKCLNDAFQKYPASQSVLVSLINLYLESKDDPNKILDLIRAAQKNEPDNASLVYAEGNVYNSMGDYENAIKYFSKSYEMDPTYVYGIYAVGNCYFEMAVKVGEEIDKLDLDDIENYERLLKQQEQYLMDSIEPFEKAFSTTDDQEVKIAVAQALKQVYFRFRDRDPKYAAGHKKYGEFLINNGVNVE